MVRITWSEQAVQDLENIAAFIALDSVRFAKITVKNIRDKTRLLKNTPLMGRVVPEAGINEIRELLYKSYRIIYHVSNNDLVQILTIHHSAKQLYS